jgi:hypothetical protein
LVNVAEIQIEGQKLTVLLNEKQFKTGSKGYWGSDKLTLPDGKRFQIQVQAVLIGSKKKEQ